MKFIDLFCGIGGFHQALNNLGHECVFASDKDESCRRVYNLNYNIEVHGDICQVEPKDIPEFDILCAGFPCQPFSKAGFQRGFKDERGNLFFKIYEIVEHHKPKYLILENVRNLKTHDDGNTWKVIRESIHTLGYNTYDEPIILNTLHFNVPQNRERVVILCKRKDLGNLGDFPEFPKNPKIHLTNYIENIITDHKEELSPKYKVVEKVWDTFVKLLRKNNIVIPKFPIWTDSWDMEYTHDDPFYVKYTSWIDKNKYFYEEHKKILEPWLLDARKNKLWFGAVRKFEWQAQNENGLDEVLWTPRSSGVRCKKIDYVPTLVAINTCPVYGPLHRTLTHRELLRLQSFPDTFQFENTHINKQVGNAVNVKMIEYCANFLIKNDSVKKK